MMTAAAANLPIATLIDAGGFARAVAALLHEDPSQFDTVKVSLAHSLPVAALIALVVAAIVAFAMSVRSTADLSRGRRITLGLLRAAAVAGIFSLLVQPELRLLKTAKIPTRAVILVDLSASMSVKDAPDGGTRWSWAREYADKLAAALRKRAGEVTVEVSAFDDVPRPMPNSNESAAATTTPPVAKIPWGRRTDVGGALAALPERHPGETISTVIVVSDGGDHGSLRRQLVAEPTPPPIAGLSGAKIYTARAGDPSRFKDVGVGDLSVDEFGFVHNPVKVEAEIDIIGYEGKRVPVTISSDQGVITTKTITAKGNNYREKVEFEITPRRTGTYTYTVATARYADESVEGNNTRPFAIKVIRDKTRVLHIAGMPSWDEKFLRQLLKNDPNVDLVSFFILRTPYDVNQYPTEAYSLIPFPTDELFNERLNTFDLVVFQNFTYRNYFGYNQNLYLSALRDFTKKGGGFVMIGGENSFGAGTYSGTPIEEILPVEVGHGDNTIDPANWQIQLTDAGKVHPITTLDFDDAANQKVWADLPPMQGFHNDLVARADATVLATVPGKRGPTGQPLPAIAVRKVGEGRSLAINGDSSWRWNFGNVGKGGTASPYLKFWQNAMRWLIKDPDLKQVRVVMDKDNYRAGDTVRGKVIVVGAGYSPLKDAVVKVAVTGESGQVDATTAPVVPPGVTNEGGEYRFEITPPARGIYRVKADVALPDHTGEKDETVFAFDTEDPELERAFVDERYLADLATRGGGVTLALDPVAAAAQIVLPPAPPVRIVGERRLGLWDKPLSLLLVLALFAAEWTLRRRWGLV
jgi:uncharacterized membrane protein